MNGTNTANAKESAIRQRGLPVLLVLILLVIVTMSTIFGERPSGQPVNIGMARNPLEYCAFAIMGSKDSNYTVSLIDEYDEIIAALKAETLDAALLPGQYIKEFNEDEYTVVAVTSYMNLVAVENGSWVVSVYDLEGRCIVIPSSIQGTPEMQMLNVLLIKTGISANIVFEHEESVWQRVQNEDFDIMILPIEQSAPVLLHSNRYRKCFNLANQWNELFGFQPPAASCIIVRDACIEEKQDALNNLLTAIEASINFTNTHRKKAALLIISNGFDGDYGYIRKTIPHCMFAYLVGENMAEPLDQLSELMALHK